MNHSKISENIFKYRKDQGLTQEQLARMLGVTPGAVCKWETGNSLPDISILAPLARALKITIDTLLSFHKQLTEQDIQGIKSELTDTFMNLGDQAGDEACQKILLKFPNNNRLKLGIAGIYQTYSMMAAPIAEENVAIQRMKRALPLLQEIIDSGDPKYRNEALYSMAVLYMMICEYDECEIALNQLAAPSYDLRPLYLRLYQERGENEKVRQIAQSSLLEQLHGSLAMLSTLNQVCGQEDDKQKKIYLSAMNLLEETFHVGLGLSAKHYMRFYYQREEYLQAAQWFYAFAERVVHFPYDYAGNLYFDSIILDGNETIQKNARIVMVSSVLEEQSEFPELVGIAEYEAGVQLFKDYLAGTNE